MLAPSFNSLASRLCVLLLPAAIAAGCKKEELVDPKLPDATESGLNTAGCKVDGKNWTAYQASIFAPPATSALWRKVIEGRFALSITMDKNDDYNEVHSKTSISLYVPDIRSTGTFELNQRANPSLANTNPAYASFSFNKPAPPQLHLTGPSAPGKLIVTRFDTVARVVAGTFEFSAVERSNTATVQVTEGRFDLKF